MESFYSSKVRSPVFHTILPVIELKIILLSVWYARKLRDKSLGQENQTLFKKSEDPEDGGLVSQRTILTWVRIQASFILKGEWVWLMVTRFLMSESFIFAAFPVGNNVPITSSKTNFFSNLNFLSLYEWKALYLSFSGPWHGLFYIFQVIGSILNL